MTRTLATLALVLLAAGCARYGAAEGVTTGRAFDYTVTRSAAFPQGYVVTDRLGRRYLCRGQVGPAARKALENAFQDNWAVTRRPDVVTTAFGQNYVCRRS